MEWFLIGVCVVLLILLAGAVAAVMMWFRAKREWRAEAVRARRYRQTRPQTGHGSGHAGSSSGRSYPSPPSSGSSGGTSLGGMI
ncbi:hypothetical protein [Nocardia rosealba]|uniref:hypothetical protein n=1 Tax=Nocardia rosealba TaxID=2878563 RepID=UPI001CD9FD36|nr:hypothetical protein [Nocardia rosealba]MCA2207159.1 hypothetical protein [Nocardia rosealba]